MLLIQQHLKNKIETPETLQERFGIHSKVSECGTMILFDYDQIESSKCKDHRLVREARGLVLSEGSWDIIAMSFLRFFNYGEGNDTEIFDWKNFSVQEKVDGSLMRLTAKSKNLSELNGDDSDILCFTRFSFANQTISELCPKTWSELALVCLTKGQKAFIRIHSKFTFVFEFCSPFTQVVKFYSEPQMIMTGIFDNQTGEEVSKNNEVYKEAKKLFRWAQEYNFTSIDEILEHLDIMFKEQSTDEGFVLKDKFGIRLKIKNKFYLALHRLSGNMKLTNIKHLVPIIMQGEIDEVVAYFPHLKDQVTQLQEMFKKDIEELRTVYYGVIDRESQKDFALFLTKEIWTPWSSIFFNLRKEFGNSFTFAQVEQAFLKAEDLVIKVYKTRGFEMEDEDE